MKIITFFGRATIQIGFLMGFLGLFSLPLMAAPTQTVLTLLHTNDVHSRYRPEAHAPHLGGMARMKTLVDRLRKGAQASLLVDGGDWSEGQLYYFLGAGVESYKMMGAMGYDVGVIGNHDFLNGAETLMEALNQASIPTQFVAANLEISRYPKQQELRSRIQPYVIKEVAGAKIAFIGLITYEFIYDRFLNPIQITSPFEAAQKLSRQLKSGHQADYVIAISHNRLAMNRKILEVAPEVDLIIGAHDHKKLTRPIIVQRPGYADGMLVETGSWGRYLGKVELQITETPASEGRSAAISVEPLSYQLLPVEPKLEQNPEILKRVETLEALLNQQEGPLFGTHVADCEDDFTHQGQESVLGNLVTDAMRDFAKTEIAVDHPRFIYGSLAKGPLSSADLYNVLPGVYNPKTHQSWTVHTLSVLGSTLQNLFSLFLSPQKLADGGAPSFSGMEITYDSPFRPILSTFMSPMEAGGGWISIQDAFQLNVLRNTRPLQKILIGGRPLVEGQEYSLSFSGGIRESFEFLDSALPGVIPLDGLRDTGVETRKVFHDYVVKNSPLRIRSGKYNSRLKTLRADLAIQTHLTKLEPAPSTEETSSKKIVQLILNIKNIGLSPSSAISNGIHIYGNEEGTQPLLEIHPVELAPALNLLRLNPGETIEFKIPIRLPEDEQSTPVWIQMDPVGDEANVSNNEWILWTDSH